MEADSTTNNDEGLANSVRNGDDGSMDGQDHFREDGEESPSGFRNDKMNNHEETSWDVNHKLEKVGSEKQLDKSNSGTRDIDTTTPFESVKAAVSMFSGIVDWKAHKIQLSERRTRVAQELRKANEEITLLKKKSEAAEESKQKVLKELDNAKRRLEELKVNLESAQTEESQAKHDAELANLRVEEIKKGVADESSVAAKAQLEVAQARHNAAVSELKTVELNFKTLQKDYTSLLSDTDLAIKNAQEAVSETTETEKNVEDLTIKMITMKEALESAHSAFLEAEEHRNEVAMAQEQELRQTEEELEKMAETEELKSKLDAALVLQQDLKEELESYMKESHKDIQSSIDLAKTDLEEVKLNIENTTDEVNNMKLYANSLEQEKATLVAMQQNKGTEALVMASLEADLMRTISEVAVIEMKEKVALWETVELPKQVEEASEGARQAKSRAKKARKELKKAKEAANKAKNGENKMMSKLNVSARGVQAAQASERFALGAISAVEVEESESARSNESEFEPEVSLPVEKYYELSQKAKKAEDEANNRVSEAISQIDLAQESEQEAMRKLEQVKADTASKKEELSATMLKAEKAKEGKLVVERELRIRRSDNEQRRKAKELKSQRKKKKPSLIPKIFTCFCAGRKDAIQTRR